MHLRGAEVERVTSATAKGQADNEYEFLILMF